MPSPVNDHKRKQNGQFIRNKCREGMRKNVTQPKGDSIKVENRSYNFKRRVPTPTFYVIKWKWQLCSACH